MSTTQENTKDVARQREDGQHVHACWPRSMREGVTGAGAIGQQREQTWADITKAGRLLGWKPEVTPEDGFQRTVNWHVANRSWLKDIKL